VVGRTVTASGSSPYKYGVKGRGWQSYDFMPVTDNANNLLQITFDGNQVTPVFSQFSGRIAQVMAEVGTMVRAGQTIAMIDTPDIVGLQTDYLQALTTERSSRTTLELSQRTRERAAPSHLARVGECLKPIVERAAEKNVRLGIEGRRGYEEIPSEREIPQLLDEIAAPHVGYWHDMGHIQIKENLGFLDHTEWLRTIAPRTIGCHMQDVNWPGQDHQPPFLGDMRLEPLTRMLPRNCQIVWELSPRLSREEILQSRTIWKERFGE